MDRNNMKPQAVLITALILFSFTAAGIEFKVDITEEPNSATYNIQYKENVSKYQQINLSSENTGSVGCNFDAEAAFRYGNKTETAYSQRKPIWSGGTEFFNIKYMPINYTGPLDTKLYVEYCDIRNNIANFTYTVDQKIVPEGKVETTTIKADDRKADVKTKVKEGFMTPKEYPAGWEVSSADIKKGKATLDYEPTIFDKRKNITYTVFSSNGEPLGETKVSLKAANPLSKRLADNLWKIAAVALFLLNLLLLAHNTSLKSLLKDLKARATNSNSRNEE
jgi:hypothetical protein